MSISKFDVIPGGLLRQSHGSRNTLTEREREVMALAHLTYRAIGEELGISEETVRTHLSRIRLKLGAESTKQAALLWQRTEAA